LSGSDVVFQGIWLRPHTDLAIVPILASVRSGILCPNSFWLRPNASFAIIPILASVRSGELLPLLLHTSPVA
jgi:hypothetical protein